MINETENKVTSREIFIRKVNEYNSNVPVILQLNAGRQLIDIIVSSMEEYAQAYHSQQIEEARKELPDDETIKAICCTNETAEGIVSATWMRSVASAIITKKDADLKHEKELRVLCSEQCDHYRKISLEQISKLDELEKWVENKIHCYRPTEGHHSSETYDAYSDVKQEILSLKQQKT